MRRILVVDDDAAAVTGLRLLLTSDGYDVVGLGRPQDALAQLADGRFDAVVTDLEMPGLHGVEVVKAAQGAQPCMPVFVVSAFADSPAGEAALRAGARRVFSKPLEYEVLLAELVLALGDA